MHALHFGFPAAPEVVRMKSTSSCVTSFPAPAMTYAFRASCLSGDNQWSPPLLASRRTLRQSYRPARRFNTTTWLSPLGPPLERFGLRCASAERSARRAGLPAAVSHQHNLSALRIVIAIAQRLGENPHRNTTEWIRSEARAGASIAIALSVGSNREIDAPPQNEQSPLSHNPMRLEDVRELLLQPRDDRSPSR